MLGSLFLCALLAAAPVQDSGAPALPLDSVARALEGLSSERAEARFAAERYLGSALGSESKQQLLDFVEAMEEGGPGTVETLWRIGNALGASPEGLGLALELVHDRSYLGAPGLDLEPLVAGEQAQPSGPDAALRTIGNHALDQLLANWRPGLDRLPVSGAAVQLLLPEQRELSIWTPLAINDGPVEEVVSRLNRLGQLPMPLVIAPGLADLLAEQRSALSRQPALGVFEGPWDAVLFDFAQAHSLAWEAVLWDGEFGDEIAWLRLVSMGEAGNESGLDQVRLALSDYARKVWGEAPRALAGKRWNTPAASQSELGLVAAFLGGIEWPAAHGWLGDLWFESQPLDHVAFAVLLDVAGRGVFDPRMLEPAGLKQLFKLGDQIGAGNGGELLDIGKLARALAMLPRLGPRGPLDGLVLKSWPGPASPAEGLYLRLVALEAIGGGGERGGLLATSTLMNKTQVAYRGPLQLAGLRVLAEVRGQQLKHDGDELLLEDPLALLQQVGTAVTAEEMGRLLFQARVQCGGPDFLSTNGPGLRPAALRAVFVAALLAGDGATCGKLLVELVRVAEPGSWQRSHRSGGAGQDVAKFFDQMSECLEVAVRRGDLMDVRNAIRAARQHSLGSAAPSVAPEQPEAFPFTALDRLELLAGAMAPERQARLTELLAQGEGASPLFEDTAAIIRLAASPGGARSRALLIQRFEGALQSPRVGAADEAIAAVEATLALLWAQNGDEEVRVMVLAAAEAAASVPSHPLSRRVLYQAWPPPSGRISLRLDQSDR
ncbi:MAG: hypothetical protein ACI9D0_001307 [Bacteroidia bacterium]|jgi:hypothetical protein